MGGRNYKKSVIPKYRFHTYAVILTHNQERIHCVERIRKRARVRARACLFGKF
jgi:hypothetical protein